MTGRRGMTLLEILASLPLITAVLAITAAAFPRLVRETPALQRVCQTGVTMSHAMRAIHHDVDTAIALPDRAAGISAGANSLILQLPGRVVCYQFDADELIRREITSQPDLPGRTTDNWSLPKARIEFKLWREDGRAYAVEVRSAVRFITQGQSMDKLANTYVYFPGASTGAGRKI